MDPLSPTASVAGIVSLGLTVTDALIKYCKKCRSQDADLAQMRDHAEQLESFISIIRTRISGSPVASADINNSFQGCQNACSSCLRDFKALDAKYAHPKPSQKFILKLKYPFDKDEFDDLRSRLQDFNVKLLAHLQLIHLDATREITSVITSENVKVSLNIESVGRQLQSSISSSQGATITTISKGLEHRIQCLFDQFKEGQRV